MPEALSPEKTRRLSGAALLAHQRKTRKTVLLQEALEATRSRDPHRGTVRHGSSAHVAGVLVERAYLAGKR